MLLRAEGWDEERELTIHWLWSSVTLLRFLSWLRDTETSSMYTEWLIVWIFGISWKTVMATINYDSVCPRYFMKITSSNPLNNSVRLTGPSESLY